MRKLTAIVLIIVLVALFAPQIALSSQIDPSYCLEWGGTCPKDGGQHDPHHPVVDGLDADVYQLVSTSKEGHTYDYYAIDVCLKCENYLLKDFEKNRFIPHTAEMGELISSNKYGRNFGTTHLIGYDNEYKCKTCSNNYSLVCDTSEHESSFSRHNGKLSNDGKWMIYPCGYLLCPISLIEPVFDINEYTEEEISKIKHDGDYQVNLGDSLAEGPESIPVVETPNNCSHDFGSLIASAGPITGGGGDHHMYQECPKCGAKYCEVYGHSYQWGITKEASCNEPGEETYKCSECGDIADTKSIPASHDFDYDHPQGTSSPYVVRYPCKRVACSVYETHTHVFDDSGEPEYTNETRQIANDLTQHERKYLQLQKCNGEHCEKSRYVDQWVIENHIWGRKESVSAKCTTDGYTVQVCNHCGIVDKVTLPKLGHKWQASMDPEKQTKETRSISGNTTKHERKYLQPQECGRANCSAKRTATVWVKESHTWKNTSDPLKASNEVRATDSTIYHERKYLQPQQCECKATRDTFSAWVKENHSGAWETTKKATCVATGTKKRTCPVCQKKMTASIAVDKNNHSFGEWRVAQTPTATTKGKLKRTCTRTGCTAYEMKDMP